jgi:hypothetical protein
MSMFLQGLFAFLGTSMFLTLFIFAACKGSGRESRREEVEQARCLAKELAR